jgi:aryl-alcohol dehydrogenase-like predicted oxidoreductase
MDQTPFGKTGLMVTRLGIGASEIGDYSLSGDDVEMAGRVLNSALDGGINFLDTGSCYRNSEELIGLTVSSRRDDYVLATKCGHVRGRWTGEDWSAETVAKSIEQSLVHMKTDHLDLVQIHSCDVSVLERGEVTEALLKAKDAGKTRLVGYSGDKEAARYAVESGLFDTLQTSFNVVDQGASTDGLLALAAEKGMGVIIKRPIANGAWGAEGSPTSEYGAEYFRRAKTMAALGPMPGAPEDRILAALGFVFAHPEVDTAIVGTQNPAHMASNIEMMEKGVGVPSEMVDEFHRRYDELRESWTS